MPLAHEWLNANSIRQYPLSERATLESVEGVAIPNDVIVDLIVLAPETVEYPCRIRRISFTGRLFSVEIVDAFDVTIAVATADIQSPDEFLTVPLKSLFFDELGTLVLGPGRSDLPSLWPVGNLEFGNLGAELEHTTCIPLERGPVTSLGIEDQSESLRGDVKIIAGSNVGLEYDFEQNALCIEIQQNEESFTPICDVGCVPGECFRPPITRINGQTGTGASCEFFIEGDGIVDVSSRDGALVVSSETIKPTDLCFNSTQAADGAPGAPGPAGPQGPDGRLICGQADCFCAVCDVEVPFDPEQVLRPSFDEQF